MPDPADVAVPPAHDWDWFGRQRLVWAEARRRLAPPAPTDPTPAVAAPPVPDWSDLLDRGPVRLDTDPVGADRADAARRSPDWDALATRADVVAALRAAYPTDPTVRVAVDGAVTDIAFLGRRGGPLEALGVRTPPRGMRWWWGHLGGTVAPARSDRQPRPAGIQLTLADVLTGYGDPALAG